MTTHKVKSWSHFFDAIKSGKKLHDLRKLDRDYKVGDILVLQRYDNINGEYTGEELQVEITYITSSKVPCAFSSSALDKNYGIFSLKILPSPDTVIPSPVDLDVKVPVDLDVKFYEWLDVKVPVDLDVKFYEWFDRYPPPTVKNTKVRFATGDTFPSPKTPIVNGDNSGYVSSSDEDWRYPEKVGEYCG